MVSGASLNRLNAFIESALVELEAREGRPLTFRTPPIPITDAEAAGFFRSVDAGFFELEPDGVCIPRTMRPSRGSPDYLVSLDGKTSSTVGLWRELLTHASLPVLLHFDLGYPRHDIALDVDSFDALAFSPSNQPLVAVEAKKAVGELEKMLVEMSAFGTEPFRLRRAPRLSNSEQKARSLLALRPRFFLAVAPTKTEAFEVHYPADPVTATYHLEPVPIAALQLRAT